MNADEARRIQEEHNKKKAEQEEEQERRATIVDKECWKIARKVAKLEFETKFPGKLKQTIERGDSYVYYGDSDGYFIGALAEILKKNGYQVKQSAYTSRDVEGNDLSPTHYSMQVRWEKETHDN